MLPSNTPSHPSDTLRATTMGHPLVVVSGAARGIGLATTRRFLAADWSCLAIDSDADGLGRLEREGSGRVHPLHADLVDGVALVSARLSTLRGPFSHVTLVNNVGGSRRGAGPLEQLTWENALETLTFNLKPTIQLIRLMLPLLRSSLGGRIVNVSSVAARSANLDVSPDYAAAKSALIGLSRQMVAELAADGVLLNTVCPGIVGTARIEQRWRDRSDGENAAVLSRIPLRRLGTPEEIAELIHFLGSASTTYMTGAVVDINGGLHLP